MSANDDTIARLRAEIAENPYDKTPYTVLADLLMERGDPHGQLIARSVEVDTYPGCTVTDPEVLALHAQHDAAWLGALASPPAGIELQWYRGFVERLAIGNYHARLGDPGEHYGFALRELAGRAPSFVRSLVFDAFAGNDYAIYLDAIDRHGAPPTVTSVWLRNDRRTPRRITGLSRLYAQLPALPMLSIDLEDVELGALALPELWMFSASARGFTRENFHALLGADLPKLERVFLSLGADTTVTVDDVTRLLRYPPPRLDELALTSVPFADALIAPLLDTPRLGMLTELDLSGGTLSDAGGELILANAARFAHLDRFVLESSRLGTAMCERLRAALPNVEVDYQETDDADEDDEDDEDDDDSDHYDRADE